MKNLKLLFFVLLLIGMAGCEREEKEKVKIEEKDILLTYQKCECDDETEFIAHISVDSILLTNKTMSSQLKPISINCNFMTREAALVQNGFIGIEGRTLYRICNFPFDSSWDIPAGGMLISFEADGYQKCTSVEDTPNHFYHDIVLTSLKIEAQ
jgi:hypothetical protein